MPRAVAFPIPRPLPVICINNAKERANQNYFFIFQRVFSEVGGVSCIVEMITLSE